MSIELVEQNELLINDPEAPRLKKSHSLLEYIINHRQDILEKVEQERNNTAKNIDKPVPIDDMNTLKRKIEYLDIIRWLAVFSIYGFLGGIFINAISKTPLVNYDMIFNLMISPIIYYHSPRNILCNIPISEFIKYYTVFFICGLCFRFLDILEDFNDFSLDPANIKTNTQIGLTIFICIILILLSIYFIVISSNPIINLLLFLFEFSIFISASYIFILLNGKIHIHHYFIGLILMLVSKNYHSKIVIITHAISYGIYIEGISKWGIDPLYWIT
jgi:hypothetical protein